MAVQLTAAQLAPLLHSGQRPRKWLTALNDAMARFRIDTATRAAAFLAQVRYESSGFQRQIEDLDYSIDRLLTTWPGRFPTARHAVPFAHRPERLANHVYANRFGNGDVASGDGWRYRGRGLFLLIGRGNFRAAGRALGLPLEQSPKMLVMPTVAALAAAWYWDACGLNELADGLTGDDDSDFVAITAILSGGDGGLVTRRAWWVRAKRLLRGRGVATGPFTRECFSEESGLKLLAASDRNPVGRVTGRRNR